MEEKALLTSDATIREAVENPSAFLMKMIGTLYDRPQTYVRRLGELNALLYFTHFLWANIAGQTSHYLRMGGWCFDELSGFDELNNLLESDQNPRSEAVDFAPVVSFWCSVDARIGINRSPN